MVYIPYGDFGENLETKTNALQIYYTKPSDIDRTTEAKAEISRLIDEGWKIASTSSINGSKRTKNVVAAVFGASGGDVCHTETITVGIEVFLVKK